MFEPLATFTVDGSLAGALVAAQVAQLGFEAKLLSRMSTLETKVKERTAREQAV